jgi:hypothetical protein
VNLDEIRPFRSSRKQPEEGFCSADVAGEQHLARL